MGFTTGRKRVEWLTEKTIHLTEKRMLKSQRDKNPEAKKEHNFLCREVKRSAKQDREIYTSRTYAKKWKKTDHTTKHDWYTMESEE